MELQTLTLYESVDPRKGHQVVEGFDDRSLFKMRQIVSERSIIARSHHFCGWLDQRHPFANEVAGGQRRFLLSKGADAAATRMP